MNVNNSSQNQTSYVLITPAYNEQDYIANTLRSMVAQTVKPIRWVIVSDGSTDKTDEIVATFEEKHDWIKLVRLSPHSDRQFAAKVHAFNTGYETLSDLDYDFVGNVDADLSFPEDYMQYLLNNIAADDTLGVVGTPFIEVGSESGYDFRFASIEHVSGACQIFRRRCFEDIGGYTPIKGGGIDWVAVTTARMKGWKTRTFTDRFLVHHRKMGTAGGSVLRARFKLGQENYCLGSHPVWQLFRSLHQMRNPPYVVGGLAILSGYLWGSLTRAERPISKELLAFARREQMWRLFGKSR